MATPFTLRLSGDDTAAMLSAGLFRVMAAEHQLNQLNVFPIPDGDTGTNMSRTVAAVLQAISHSGPYASPHDVLATAAREALLAARGNSGVILAEVFRGLAAGVAGGMVLDAPASLAALQHARDFAYQAVARPVEGTVLTALAEAAGRVDQCIAQGQMDQHAVWQAATEGAREATTRGPELLPVLREHGVVDAAALGLCYWFAGMVEWLEGHGTAEAAVGSVAAPGAVPGGDPSAPFGWEVQFLLSAGTSRAEIKAALEGLGESLVVSGGDGLYRVHIHTGAPEPVLVRARSLGTVTRPTVDVLTSREAD
jgi:dihydroxyacetone kinase-like predicted kinase